MKVVIPAMISVRTVVPCSFSLNLFSIQIPPFISLGSPGRGRTIYEPIIVNIDRKNKLSGRLFAAKFFLDFFAFARKCNSGLTFPQFDTIIFVGKLPETIRFW